MICPRCTASDLFERDHDGVTIDVCKECRGVWLDRGELEKLIARATRDLDEIAERRPARAVPPPPEDPRSPYRDPHEFRPRRREGSSGDYDLNYHEDRRRRRKWYEGLGDIFD